MSTLPPVCCKMSTVKGDCFCLDCNIGNHQLKWKMLEDIYEMVMDLCLFLLKVISFPNS